ncbi:biorientation of chromosomes in cell division protein 1-like 1 [Cyprinodon tularosa]|uniref:biorientation of chromosomes in cell division protein 1-like 1 n=1 Tax=Cyprinodon tularosa TaxID=77115 RepID=UPI0018E25103|nr:biorientation of chromosomes in cell division protein 1-like 1 [Cyprinodon tularosa]
MAGLPPGDPQLVSMIVSHLKTQGLFDQFRRDCLADVDTKPAYLNLKQRVDNFVSNHLSNHTWSPHLNKNQLRNNIRQLVLQSGMLEQGVDRIVAQVVDPKVNHIFRPQVERVVREFLSPGSCSEEPMAPLTPAEIKTESNIPEQASSSAPTPATGSNAMSILETISSLNMEASVRTSSASEKAGKTQAGDEPMELVEESESDMEIIQDGDSNLEGTRLEDSNAAEVQAAEVKTENLEEQMEVEKEPLKEEVKVEEEESGALEKTEEKKEKPASKLGGKASEDKSEDEAVKSTSPAKQKARERIKEEYSLEDSDLEGLSDITVSSVHTSDLSSFEEESDEDEEPSDSSEEGELPADDQGEKAEWKPTADETDGEDKERKPRRKAYVHKPFLYSRYYSDSDDEVTVEERRRSAAKDKEDRLLKRQQNRERLEEKRKQKAAQAEEQDKRKTKGSDAAGLESPKAKEARKERKVLEKKMALNRKRKLDSRKEGDVFIKKKGETGEISKKSEVKQSTSKALQAKLVRNLSESASADDRPGRTSGSVSEVSSETKKLSEKSRTHSFILDLEQGSQEALKQRSFGKFDRLPRKERKEKERSQSDERSKLKQKHEKKPEHLVEEPLQRDGGAKVPSEEKTEKKVKVKSEKKISGIAKEGKVTEDSTDEGGSKDPKKIKGGSMEKDKIKEKDKSKEKEKAKGDKSLMKSDLKQLNRPDSAGSSEDRSDKEPNSESTKKKEKHSKDVLKRSKSHSEDRPGDKPKSKTDGEKERRRTDGQRTHKSNPETEKDSKKVKPADKDKSAEKPNAKPKEEAKAASSVKMEKKPQSPDVRSALICKPEAVKGKKKDGSQKEQKKASEDAALEKSELKMSKKKLEKKDKVPEKKIERQEDKPQKDDRAETLVKPSRSDEPPKKQAPLQEANTESDPPTATTSFSDDTCDALSDITPEPSEGEAESQPPENPGVRTEANALMTLMDVCASAEARLSSESPKEEVTPEMELQDADMKMKEAALTLLSMDPDSTVSSSVCTHGLREDPQSMDTTETASLSGPMVTEASPAASEHSTTVEASLQIELTVPETSLETFQQTSGAQEERPLHLVEAAAEGSASPQTAAEKEEKVLPPVDAAPGIELTDTEAITPASPQTAAEEVKHPSPGKAGPQVEPVTAEASAGSPPQTTASEEENQISFMQAAASGEPTASETEPTQENAAEAKDQEQPAQVDATEAPGVLSLQPATEEVQPPSLKEEEPQTEQIATEVSSASPQRTAASEEESQLSFMQAASGELTAPETKPAASLQTTAAAEDQEQLALVEAPEASGVLSLQPAAEEVEPPSLMEDAPQTELTEVSSALPQQTAASEEENQLCFMQAAASGELTATESKPSQQTAALAEDQSQLPVTEAPLAAAEGNQPASHVQAAPDAEISPMETCSSASQLQDEPESSESKMDACETNNADKAPLEEGEAIFECPDSSKDESKTTETLSAPADKDNDLLLFVPETEETTSGTGERTAEAASGASEHVSEILSESGPNAAVRESNPEVRNE